MCCEGGAIGGVAFVIIHNSQFIIWFSALNSWNRRRVGILADQDFLTFH